MRLKLKRVKFSEKSTIGTLYINDVFECWTLEDIVREIPNVAVEQWKVKGQTAIPVGTYRVVIDFSNRFQKMMPHILSVEGFEGIRIHSGNTAEDTEGCILVGQSYKAGEDRIGLSRLAYESLFIKLEDAFKSGEKVYITIEGLGG